MFKLYPLVVVALVLAVIDVQWPEMVDLSALDVSKGEASYGLLGAVSEIVAPMGF
jgi:hypothetical protein